MDYLTMIKMVLLLTLVGISTYTDVKDRRIPNKVTVPFALAGLLVNTLFNFPEGLKVGLYGLGVGFFIFFVPYLMGAMGGGDVKLMAAVGAITNPLATVVIGITTTLVGGVMIIAVRLKRGELLRTFKRMGQLILFYIFSSIDRFVKHPKIFELKEANRLEMTDDKLDFIPYGVAIAGGSIVTIGLYIFDVIPNLYF